MNEIFHLINEMSPYLLLGFLIAGLMHAFIPGKYYTRYLAKPNFRSVLNAALFGVPLPLCSCGVIPTAMSLRKEGASKGAVASFLIATPQTGVDSIIATYSLMGLPFAIIRPIVAFITALFGGSLVNRVTKKESQRVNESTSQQVEAHDHCHEEEEKTESCCCHRHEENSSHLHQEGVGEASDEEHCHCHHAETKEGMTFWQKIVVALRYAFVDMVEDIGKWLVVGLVIAALITVLVPDSFFAVFKDNTWLSMLLVLVISIPMYICATGSIPIAVALMLKGLTPGSALVLLMAGPAANMASILVIRHRLGMKTL
ncbi:MAG: SO_0444 family Cu/Zn efflux transporter, partial [Bacteroidaceae bacterium]|nr:SO_0444 family Cu/Zn efflux transporter [Bacteroidaceae bacterium]